MKKKTPFSISRIGTKYGCTSPFKIQEMGMTGTSNIYPNVYFPPFSIPYSKRCVNLAMQNESTDIHNKPSCTQVFSSSVLCQFGTLDSDEGENLRSMDSIYVCVYVP